MKQYRAESQKVLDLMINSIYTHKEIFLRELLSNASDAIDKLYYKSLEENLGLSKGDFAIKIDIDKDLRKITISDNGIGMNAKELEDNLGVIAKSGSLDFKKDMEAKEDLNIIGQFGVGFYSAFMVSDKVEVLTRSFFSDDANLFTSEGTNGYAIEEAHKDGFGTSITMYLKQDSEDENYSEFLEEFRIRELVKKYSDYIRYPIQMDVKKQHDVDGKEEEYIDTDTLNSMIPIWKKVKADITEDEYNEFYKNTFYDYENPLKTINTSAEGVVNYNAVLFIPSRAPYNYYTKSYEKGLKLYTNDVMIMEKCSELLPDYFGFVKGIVESDLTLNISRETIQHNHQLKRIARGLEKKIKRELLDLMEANRELYEKFFKEFGMQIKYGIYDSFGQNKENLQDLVMLYSLNEDKLITLKEYVAKMKENQKYIYYVAGKTKDVCKALPQTERFIELGYDILCLTEDIDEFTVKVLEKYDEKSFKSVSADDLGLDGEEKEDSDLDKKLLAFIKDTLGDEVKKVKLSSRLKTHPVCLTTEGELSIEMEKVFSAMPGGMKGLSAQKVLEINRSHPIYEKLMSLYQSDKDMLKKYCQILLTEASLIEGLPPKNPSEYASLLIGMLSE